MTQGSTATVESLRLGQADWTCAAHLSWLGVFCALGSATSFDATGKHCISCTFAEKTFLSSRARGSPGSFGPRAVAPHLSRRAGTCSAGLPACYPPGWGPSCLSWGWFCLGVLSGAAATAFMVWRAIHPPACCHLKFRAHSRHRPCRNSQDAAGGTCIEHVGSGSVPCHANHLHEHFY